MKAQQPIAKIGTRLIVRGYRVVVDSIRNNGVVCRNGNRVFVLGFWAIEEAIADEDRIDSR